MDYEVSSKTFFLLQSKTTYLFIFCNFKEENHFLRAQPGTMRRVKAGRLPQILHGLPSIPMKRYTELCIK